MLAYKSTKDFFMTYALIVLFTVGAFLIRLSKFDEFSFDFHVNITLLSFVLITVSWELLRSVNLLLNRYYPFERNISGRILLQISLGIGIGILIRFMIYTFGEPHVPIKLDSFFLAATWAIYVLMPTGINFVFFTIYFIKRWKDSIVYAERLEKEKSQVQFDNLKNQLNPHFLFNALTSLNSLIFENQQLASDFLQQLSRVYRYVLQNRDKNFVLLSTELEFISNYVKLLETRFEGALKINFDIHESATQQAIVPVTLQVLIENALKHNIADKQRPLLIDIVSMGEYLVISNNLQLKKRVDGSNRQGLDNLKSFYRFLTTKPVIIEQSDERFYVKIPLI